MISYYPTVYHEMKPMIGDSVLGGKVVGVGKTSVKNIYSESICETYTPGQDRLCAREDCTKIDCSFFPRKEA